MLNTRLSDKAYFYQQGVSECCCLKTGRNYKDNPPLPARETLERVRMAATWEVFSLFKYLCDLAATELGVKVAGCGSEKRASEGSGKGTQVSES